MRWPAGALIFGNRLIKRAKPGHMLPAYIVAVSDEIFHEFGLECIRPDNQDTIYYQPSELKPLTPAAKEMLAIARGK